MLLTADLGGVREPFTSGVSTAIPIPSSKILKATCGRSDVTFGPVQLPLALVGKRVSISAVLKTLFCFCGKLSRSENRTWLFTAGGC